MTTCGQRSPDGQWVCDLDRDHPWQHLAGALEVQAVWQ